MSLDNVNTVVAPEAAVVVEKEPRIALPEIAEADYKVLTITNAEVPSAGVAFLNISDITEYAQFAAVARTCSHVKIAGNAKGCVVAIDGSHPLNAEKVVLLNPELTGKVVVANITYNGAERLRISAKAMGVSKAKKSIKSSFYDQDLAGMVYMAADDYNYIYGKEETEYTKEKNTIICRVVKALVPFGLLYSDEDKSGFHKGISRIPAEYRSKDSYGWFFDWAEIAAKLAPEVVLAKLEKIFVTKALDAKVKITEVVEGVVVELTVEEIAAAKAEAAKVQAELALDAAKVQADIVAIINAVYPEVTVDTTKVLWIEALYSEFAKLKSERLVFENGAIVSKKAEVEAANAAKAQAKLDKKAEEDANKAAKAEAKAAAKAEAAANKKAKVKEELGSESVAVELDGISTEAVVAAPVIETAVQTGGLEAVKPLTGGLEAIKPLDLNAKVADGINPPIGINMSNLLDTIDPVKA